MSAATRLNQRVLSATRYHAVVECCNCRNYQTVERDADGASIEQFDCHGQRGCTARPCDACSFVCAICDQRSCVQHRVIFAKSHICEVCYAREVLECPQA